MKLTIELIQEDDEPGWFVRVVEKPGCMSEGDTISEALAMIVDAMTLWDEVDQELNLVDRTPNRGEFPVGEFANNDHQ